MSYKKLAKLLRTFVLSKPCNFFLQDIIIVSNSVYPRFTSSKLVDQLSINLNIHFNNLKLIIFIKYLYDSWNNFSLSNKKPNRYSTVI